MSLLYRFRDEDLLTDDEDDNNEQQHKKDYVDKYFSSGLEESMSDFTNAKPVNDAQKVKRVKDLYVTASSGGSGKFGVAVPVEVDFEFASVRREPVRTTVSVTPAIVTAQNMKLESSGQSLNMLTPNIPTLVLPQISVVDLRTSDGLLDGVGKNLASLAGDAARKIFATFFLACVRAGLVTKADTLTMAREADAALRTMELQLEQTMTMLTKRGSSTTQANQTNQLLEDKLRAIQAIKARLNNTDPLTADLTRSMTNVSVSNNIYDLQRHQQMAQQLQQQRHVQDNTEDSQRLLKTILRMQHQTKEVLMQFVQSIQRSDTQTNDVALKQLIAAFETAIDSRVQELLNAALRR
jgi:hypothetical protein